MKESYLRIFFIISIIIIFSMLLARWQLMFTPSENRSVNNHKILIKEEQKNQEEKRVSIVDDDVIDPASIEPLVIDTEVFDNLSLSPINGSLIHASFKDYNISLSDNTPLTLINNTEEKKYIAQPLIKLNGTKKNIIFKEKSIVNNNNTKIIQLVGKIGNVTIERQYIIEKSSYAITLKQKVTNNDKKNITVSFNNEIMRKANPEKSSWNIFDAHSYSFEGIGLSSKLKPFQKESFTDLKKDNIISVNTNIGWAAMIQHYFVTLWVPYNSKNEIFKVYATKMKNHLYQCGVETKPVTLRDNESLTNVSVLYTGPIITKNLESIVENFNENQKPKGLDKLVDYGILSFISVVIFWLMNFINLFVGNWGIAIILVTVIIKLIFYPLSAKSYKSMAKMRILQPRMKKLQELYKGDRQKLGRKMMEMYKEEKVNPASGCLPILIQIPVFIALYWVLLESVQLRQADFIFWIHDLSSKDPLFILPILMGISMFIQQKLSPSSADPMQAKIMMLMPIIFTIFFASFPSGLVLYWLTNNVVSILQQWHITKKYSAK